MAKDKSSKTEKATPKKLRDTRKKGRVPKSKDVSATTILLFLFVYFIFSMGSIQENLKVLMLAPKDFFSLNTTLATAAMTDVISRLIVINIIIPIALVTIISAIAGNVLQFGFIFAFDPIKPKMSKIDPVAGFKRIFSLHQVKTTLVSMIKIIAISFALYFVVQSFLENAIFDLNQCGVDCQWNILGHFVFMLVMAVLLMNIALSVVDYILERAKFMKDQKMSKEEVKREYKNMEGDPEIKGKRKQLQQKIAGSDIKQTVKESRIVIYSSGLAISLLYEEGVHPLPIITSIGKAKMADKMIEIAQTEKMPTYESLEIALSIIKEGQIDQYIPEDSISGVVKALRSTNQ